MKLVAAGILLSLAMLAYSADPPSTTLNYAELAKYRCPFGMFNQGHPALLDDGNIMFCDAPDAICPRHHFCSAGYPDGRNVCCHILAYSADPPSTTLNYEELAKYRCPFGMFNMGHPALLDDGNIMFCDGKDVVCPNYHFCAAGYADGRAVCCHILAYSADPPSTTLNYAELAKYRCPFGMFNQGHPALLDDGNIMFCDAPDAICPRHHFCSAGYPDGRNVCCHILAYSADPPSTTLNYEELAKYRCPFGMFNMGHPALLDDGNIMFCDGKDVVCPNYHFCAAGYADGRAVCCHILGP